jgi:ketosteroid isomerase-like protein
MSQASIELVRRAFYPPGAPDLVSTFADRDALAATLEPYLHPDFEVVEHEMAPPDLRGGKGGRAFVDMYAEWLGAWESFHVTPIEFHDLGDRVLAVVRMGGRTRTHGAEVEQESAVIFGIEEGLIRSVKLFTQAEDARREAGLAQ